MTLIYQAFIAGFMVGVIVTITVIVAYNTFKGK
jgi:hypothetical protein